MIIAAVVKNDEIKGEHLIQASRDECQEIQKVFTAYCAANKRMKIAKRMLKEFDDNLQVW